MARLLEGGAVERSLLPSKHDCCNRGPSRRKRRTARSASLTLVLVYPPSTRGTGR